MPRGGCLNARRPLERRCRGTNVALVAEGAHATSACGQTNVAAPLRGLHGAAFAGHARARARGECGCRARTAGGRGRVVVASPEREPDQPSQRHPRRHRVPEPDELLRGRRLREHLRRPSAHGALGRRELVDRGGPVHARLRARRDPREHRLPEHDQLHSGGERDGPAVGRDGMDVGAARHAFYAHICVPLRGCLFERDELCRGRIEELGLLGEERHGCRELGRNAMERRGGARARPGSPRARW